VHWTNHSLIWHVHYQSSNHQSNFHHPQMAGSKGKKSTAAAAAIKQQGNSATEREEEAGVVVVGDVAVEESGLAINSAEEEGDMGVSSSNVIPPTHAPVQADQPVAQLANAEADVADVSVLSVSEPPAQIESDLEMHPVDFEQAPTTPPKDGARLADEESDDTDIPMPSLIPEGRLHGAASVNATGMPVTRNPIHVIQISPNTSMTTGDVKVDASPVLADMRASVTPVMTKLASATSVASPRPSDIIMSPGMARSTQLAVPRDTFNPARSGSTTTSTTTGQSFTSRLSASIPAFFTAAFSQTVKENLGPQWAHATAQPEVEQAIAQIGETEVTLGRLEKAISRQRSLYAQLNGSEDELALLYRVHAGGETDTGLRQSGEQLSACLNVTCVDRLAVIAALDCFLDYLHIFQHKALVDLKETVGRQRHARLEMDALCSKYGELEERHIKVLSASKDDTVMAQAVADVKAKFVACKDRYIQLSRQVLDKTGLLELKREVDVKAHLENVRQALDKAHGRTIAAAADVSRAQSSEPKQEEEVEVIVVKAASPTASPAPSDLTLDGEKNISPAPKLASVHAHDPVDATAEYFVDAQQA
jgi:hypothetical protein